jgi:hypothetical protein
MPGNGCNLRAGVASCDAFPPWLASSQASQQNRTNAMAGNRPAVSTTRTTRAQITPFGMTITVSQQAETGAHNGGYS